MFFDRNSDCTRYEHRHGFRAAANALLSPNHTVPTRDQLALYWPVHEAIIRNGLFYSRDVYAFVIDKIKHLVSKEDLARRADRVDGGDIGMLIYYMREKVERNAKLQANLDALAYFKPFLQAGAFLKKISVNGKTYDKARIHEVDALKGEILIECFGRGIKATNRPAYRLGANHPAIQDCLKQSKLPSGVSCASENGISTFIINPSSHNKSHLCFVPPQDARVA